MKRLPRCRVSWRWTARGSGASLNAASRPRAWPRTIWTYIARYCRGPRLRPSQQSPCSLRQILAIRTVRGFSLPKQQAQPQPPPLTVALVEQVPEVPFYIPATGPSTRPRRTLKHGDCFAVFDSHGDIGATPGGPDGIYFTDTRHLSHLEILLNGMHPLLLGSNVRDDNSILTVDLTNPDIYLGQKLL